VHKKKSPYMTCPRPQKTIREEAGRTKLKEETKGEERRKAEGRNRPVIKSRQIQMTPGDALCRSQGRDAKEIGAKPKPRKIERVGTRDSLTRRRGARDGPIGETKGKGGA